MSDDPTKRGKADRSRISTQRHERAYWCKKFGITHFRLRVAVATVGPMVKDVKRYLIARIKAAK